MSEGRWVGRYYEWSCETCQHVVQTPDPPPRGEALCSGCHAQREVASASTHLARVIAERDELGRQLAAARRQIGDLEDTIASIQMRAS